MSDMTSSTRSRKQPRIGPGKFQWNKGAWFGGLVGGTAWLLVGGMQLLPDSRAIAALWFGCFAVVQAVAIVLFWRRSSIAPYEAIQTLLGLVVVLGGLAWTTVVRLRPDLLPLMQMDAVKGYSVLLVILAMMIGFHLQEVSERR